MISWINRKKLRVQKLPPCTGYWFFYGLCKGTQRTVTFGDGYLLASRDKIKNFFAQSPLVHIKSMAYNKADEAFLEKVAEFIIAAMTGFGSQAHFGKSFVKQFGVSPHDYVNNGKKTAMER